MLVQSKTRGPLPVQPSFLPGRSGSLGVSPSSILRSPNLPLHHSIHGEETHSVASPALFTFDLSSLRRGLWFGLNRCQPANGQRPTDDVTIRLSGHSHSLFPLLFLSLSLSFSHSVCLSLSFTPTTSPFPSQSLESPSLPPRVSGFCTFYALGPSLHLGCLVVDIIREWETGSLSFYGTTVNLELRISHLPVCRSCCFCSSSNGLEPLHNLMPRDFILFPLLLPLSPICTPGFDLVSPATVKSTDLHLGKIDF